MASVPENLTSFLCSEGQVEDKIQEMGLWEEYRSEKVIAVVHVLEIEPSTGFHLFSCETLFVSNFFLKTNICRE